MSDTHENGPEQTVEADLRRQQQAQLSRFFLTFAVIEGVVLMAAVIVIFVLQLIDPDVGIWALLALVVLGATVLSGYLLTTTRRHQRERDESARR